MQAFDKLNRGLTVFVKDIANGCFEIAHNGFAVIGLATAVLLTALFLKPELRSQSENAVLGWLLARQSAVSASSIESVQAEPEAIERATATDPKDLPKQQAAVAFWLSKKYRVAPEPIGALVAEAYDIGLRTKLDPTLILAIMAIESSFNPFAQSPVGAQGLMQVMTKIHTDKYEGFGGDHAAFDPVTNLRVGVKVLQECIQRAGSVEMGLRYYVGATSDATEGGYAGKVLAEQARLQQVALGKAVPFIAPAPSQTIPTVAPHMPAAPATPRVEPEKIAAL